LKVALATTHISFRSICQRLNAELIEFTTIETAKYLRIKGVVSPKIAIAGLNPHAGSGDILGDEENLIIEPAIIHLKDRGVNCTGPVAPDSVFHRAICNEFDAVVSLYHDQGSIAVKTYDFYHTVNVTLGLPIIRTSVDHGTAYAIAGKMKASTQNLRSAIDLAFELITRKNDNRSNINATTRS
jgi:4-phospho-D-threonate 3-dehydrogenase / 4-phospho-D-erythronate 3-dehydrogenase